MEEPITIGLHFAIQSIDVSDLVDILAPQSTSLLPEATQSTGRSSLLEHLLFEQQDLTAVEYFSKQFDSDVPEQAKYYRSLLPATPPSEGEQYAFDVDLDRCSGCKACVTACHRMNGLDEGEAWRDVGLLIGGDPQLPVLQHVTTACHHCVDPACANGCPVDAYEKDPITGIVKHLDDQCFGCQYCTLACPYDVPKYNAELGIVRKCDMCSDRLADGEAPACVQACPHEAIQIRVVNVAETQQAACSGSFLTGAPNPDYTIPTTRFRSNRGSSEKLVPADLYAVQPEHAHWALVIMLVLTQLSVGAFCVEWLLAAFGLQDGSSPVPPFFALACGLIAIAASTMHLGRPQYAFRAIIGLRHSWLSREILAFGVFAGLASAYAAAISLRAEFFQQYPTLRVLLGGGVAVSGLAGVFCSAMIYHVVRRPFWHLTRSLPKFILTSIVLGSLAAAVSIGIAYGTAGLGQIQSLMAIAAVAGLFKLFFDGFEFGPLRDHEYTARRRSAILMCGPLRQITIQRYIAGFIGTVALPLVITTASPAIAPMLFLSVVTLALGCVAELSERYLFFTAVVRQKMPGGLTL